MVASPCGCSLSLILFRCQKKKKVTQLVVKRKHFFLDEKYPGYQNFNCQKTHVSILFIRESLVVLKWFGEFFQKYPKYKTTVKSLSLVKVFVFLFI